MWTYSTENATTIWSAPQYVLTLATSEFGNLSYSPNRQTLVIEHVEVKKHTVQMDLVTLKIYIILSIFREK
jgi:hypothetical protein